MERKTFTLIEVLVVVAIIAVLVAVLLPALGRVRSLAQRSACAANQHQLYLGTLMFAQEQNGLLWRHPNLPGDVKDRWDSNAIFVIRTNNPDKEIWLSRYFSKQRNIFYCPGNRVRWNTTWPWAGQASNYDPAWGGRHTSAGYEIVITYANLANIYDLQEQQPIAEKITDDPTLGLFTDCDYWMLGYDGYTGWYIGNHPSQYSEVNPGIDLEGRNLLRLGGDVTWSAFTDEMRTRCQLGAWTYIAF